MVRHKLHWFVWIVFVFILSILPVSPTLAQDTALSSTFSYQGFLTDSGGTVSGTCDFQFSLFPVVSGGTQIGSTITQSGIVVNSGVFNVLLDFGSAASVDPVLLVQLVQSDAKTYKLRGAHRLQFRTPLDDVEQRYRFVEKLLTSLGSAAGAEAALAG